jgi:cobyrinic acid a,c-diamide synthase
MMALFETLSDVDGREHQLGGLLPGNVRMQKRLAGLGMQEAELPEGTLRGHAFHYSKTDTELVPICTSTRPDGRDGETIYRCRRLTASYMHLYFPSNPQAVARLFQ